MNETDKRIASLVTYIRHEVQKARQEVSDVMPDPLHAPEVSDEALTFWYGIGRVEALADVMVQIGVPLFVRQVADTDAAVEFITGDFDELISASVAKHAELLERLSKLKVALLQVSAHKSDGREVFDLLDSSQHMLEKRLAHYTLRGDLGLEVVETFVYYDQPTLYVGKDADGAHYLVVLSDDEQYAETWLLARITQKTVEDLINGSIDFYSVFKQAEGGEVKKAVALKYGLIGDEMVKCDDLDDDDLPMAGYKVEKDG